MKKILFLAVLCLFIARPAFSVVMFGEDLGLGDLTRLPAHPNADAARASFLSSLTGVGTEDFESLAPGTVPPIALTFPGAGTATLFDITPGGPFASVANIPAGTDAGRYPISGNQFINDVGNLRITFSAPVAAFGFYGVDIGDFDGQLTLTLTDGSVANYVVPNTVNGPGGSVLFWGIIDTANPFLQVEFGNTASGVDGFGFDDMTIGSVQQVIPQTPEPSTLMLLGTGVVGFAASFRRKRRG